MDAFAKEHASEIERLYQENLSEEPEPNNDDKKKKVLNGIIEEQTIKFFLNNNNDVLNQYAKHLNTNLRWATTNELYALHREITNERLVRDTDGRVHSHTETSIELGVEKDGVAQYWRTPDIILNNYGNVHWVSCIKPSEVKRYIVPNNASKEDQKKVGNTIAVINKITHSLEHSFLYKNSKQKKAYKIQEALAQLSFDDLLKIDDENTVKTPAQKRLLVALAEHRHSFNPNAKKAIRDGNVVEKYAADSFKKFKTALDTFKENNKKEPTSEQTSQQVHRK